MNRIDDALQMYKRSVDTSKGQHLTAYINLASVYFNKGDMMGCIDNINLALDLNAESCREALALCGLDYLIEPHTVKKCEVKYHNGEMMNGILLLDKTLPDNEDDMAVTCYFNTNNPSKLPS